ncbi:hypothetical protein MHYP_G00219170 [Metynnis hypsauchen]
MALGKLGAFLKQHPWRSYTMLYLVLIVLEKLVEEDFVCPCRLGFTWIFFSLYLAMPLLIAANFGVYMWKSSLCADSGQQSRCECSSKCCVDFLTCTIPSVFWLVLFFGDGRYVACLITQLKEDHVDSSELPPWEWCDKQRILTDDQNQAKEAFYISKVVVFSFISFILFVALICQCVQCCKKQAAVAQPTNTSATVSEA